jgi:hypothetical protein
MKFASPIDPKVGMAREPSEDSGANAPLLEKNTSSQGAEKRTEGVKRKFDLPKAYFGRRRANPRERKRD